MIYQTRKLVFYLEMCLKVQQFAVKLMEIGSVEILVTSSKCFSATVSNNVPN